MRHREGAQLQTFWRVHFTFSRWTSKQCDAADSPNIWPSYSNVTDTDPQATDQDKDKAPQQAYTMHSALSPPQSKPYLHHSPLEKPHLVQESESESSMKGDDEDSDIDLNATTTISRKQTPAFSQAVNEVLPDRHCTCSTAPA